MPMLGIMASGISGNLWAPAGAYDSISTATVTSGGTSSITFSSIPQTYTHLQLRGFLQANRSDYPIENTNIVFNSDTAGNYSFHYLDGGLSANVQSAVSGGSINQASILLPNSAGDTAGGQFGTSVTDILDYANTNKYKTIRYLGGDDINTTVLNYAGHIVLGSGNWRSTVSINSITITPQSSSLWNQYSQISLYGIK